MEDFNIGAIMSGIVATIICSVFGYLFFSKTRAKKQKLRLDGSEVRGDIDQTIENDDNNIESEQVIDFKNTIVDGGISQTSNDKKKH
ncbi:TPA: hypothetical protein ACMDOB_002527 [Vibrio metschnikovii]|uniref:hypothetical protein n=1 Tax=Vibrio TaxID=662 RepID=UPI00084A3830|nr:MULTISPECIES: hypothetical protein [Vibrio]EGQ9303929.1 hypothetical protein [Vibrio parahaemolyticus]EGR9007572.1 hypothetical protein [Vibrio vulnificus]EID0062747.1 hypothetical protein [Vibrio vulnificus]EID0719008.1 hypothetical protein [Vibrio vulnificus]EID0743300.1 hypothetical protein [Vibrio vulnificus]